MAWRDQMQRGSFRGVAFGVESQETAGGRRVAKHEYPGRDTPWQEDMGRKSRTHTLELHIIGADYMTGRDNMLAALEKSGPGELVHPWLGRLQVQVEGYRLSETTRAGGIASFSVTFLEAGQRNYPAATVDTASGVTMQGDAVRLAVQQQFAAAFSVTGQPGWVGDAAGSLLQQATTTLTGLIQSIPTIPSVIPAVLAQIGGFESALSSLMRTPASLAAQMDGIIASVGSLFANPLDGITIHQSLAQQSGSQLLPVPTTTPARKQQAANQQAVVEMVQHLSLANEAVATSKTTPAASGDALQMRDDLADRLDVAATAAASDRVYLALTDLRAAVVSDLTARAATLPRIAHITPATTLPSLVVAHTVYGDALRDGDIISRNHLMHPGFVPGGQPLEVLRG